MAEGNGFGNGNGNGPIAGKLVTILVSSALGAATAVAALNARVSIIERDLQDRVTREEFRQLSERVLSELKQNGSDLRDIRATILEDARRRR